MHTQEEINYHSSREKMRMDARLILDGVSKKYTSFQSMPFMEQLVGSTKESNIPAFNGGVQIVELKKRFWTVFRIKGLKSTEYSLEIPTIKINGTVFQIPRIDFRVKTGMFLQFEVYP